MSATHTNTPALRFAKMHGLGNDFVVVEAIRQTIAADAANVFTPAVLRRWGSRHTGIGFDQLLLLSASDEAGVNFRYRIFNADGSEVGQCGNGVRCAHYFLLQQGITDKTTLVFETITTRMTTMQVGESRFRVQLPPPQFFDDFEESGFAFHHLNVGNPHAVCFSNDMSDGQLNRIGENLNRPNPHFTDGANVSCAMLQDDGIALRVYERGVGMTQSCGSGCLAAAVASIQQGHRQSPVQVRMAGGAVLCGQEEGGAWLEGDVAYVFDGEIPL